MSGSSTPWYDSALGSLGSLISTAGKDYLNAKYSQRSASATPAVYTTQSTTNPATQTVPQSSTATVSSSSGGSMFGSLTTVEIVAGVAALGLIAYMVMRRH